MIILLINCLQDVAMERLETSGNMSGTEETGRNYLMM